MLSKRASQSNLSRKIKGVSMAWYSTRNPTLSRPLCWELKTEEWLVGVQSLSQSVIHALIPRGHQSAHQHICNLLYRARTSSYKQTK